MSQAATTTKTEERPWKKELDSLARAMSGAFLFGTPLLFTMEMWWIGTYAELWRLLIFLAVTLVVNVILALLSGFKEGSSLAQAVEEAFEAVAVGAVASTLMLLVLGRVQPGDPLDSILGKIVLQTIPLSIGASAANALLGRGSNGQQSGESSNSASQKKSGKSSPGMSATWADLGATVAGGLFIGFSIAPTEEVPMLATELDVMNKLALIAFTLAITYLIVFESDFSPGSGQQQGLFQRPFPETVFSYVVSLGVALVALYMFGQLQIGNEPLNDIVSKVLVLGTPTAIGGAAGRALIGGGSSG